MKSVKSTFASATIAVIAIIGIAIGTTSAGLVMPTLASAATADTIPPATPGNFRLEKRTGSELRFNWDWAADGGGGYVTQYEISYAGRTVLVDHYYPGHTQNVSDLNLSSGHSYTFTLRAIDQAGNRSQPTQLVFETTPPNAPRNLRVVGLDEQNQPDDIAFTAASDNGGPIRDYEVFLNGKSIGMTPGTDPEFSLREQTLVIACIGVPSGSNTVQLRAFDSSYNPGPLSAPLTVVFP